MNRYARCLAIALGLGLLTGAAPALAQRPDLPSQMQAVVRSVDADQLTVELEDGTRVLAASREQIDEIRPGAKLNFLYRDNGTGKQLVRILAVTD